MALSAEHAEQDGLESGNPTLTKPSAGYESQRIRLTSPALHIGSESQRLSPFEYVATNQYVYLPDVNALTSALLAKGTRYLNDYINRINRRDGLISLLENALGEDWQQAKSPDGRTIFPEQRRSLRQTNEPISDLRPMIRNGMGDIYVPGSSIKGAIRTAIAYHLLKHTERYQVPQQQRMSQIELQLRQSMGTLRKQAKFVDDRLFMNALFSDFSLSYQEKLIKARLGPNTDFMRAVKVSDAVMTSSKKGKTQGKRDRPTNISAVPEVVVASYFGDRNAKYRASIYAEILFQANLEFTLSIDTEMLSWFTHNQQMKIPFSSIDDLLAICREFAQDQWDFEHDHWHSINNNQTKGRNLDFDRIRELYSRETCPYHLRLGWGSGFNGVTIGLNIDDQLRAKIRDTVGLKAPNFAAPKSRRVIVDKNSNFRTVLGWVKFRSL